MQNFKLTIEYDGTGYHGWQRQAQGPTIQGEIEKALRAMTRAAITLIGSGRTDAGVHALGQVANFRCATRLSADVFQRGLNSLLPPDIVIKRCQVVDAQFHARFDAQYKTYRYRILNRPTPAAIDRQYAWHVRQALDRECMSQAADHLLGTHDFSAFEASGSPRAHSVRCVLRAEVATIEPDGLMVEIQADGFLRFMVRNIVGTLVMVGLGRMPPEAVGRIMASRDRAQAGATAPPHGLFLVEVQY
ncbi:MAG: tRNA pseudouridine(38-40) synthase TruA [Desulfobacterales bacterium]|nr:tRNA pseudouridine(38-40) synthase TruA [Desulfobacterales bacterium]